MSALKKLNLAYATGSLLIGALIGAVTESWWVFALAVAVLLTLNLLRGEIRPPRPQQGRRTAGEDGP